MNKEQSKKKNSNSESRNKFVSLNEHYSSINSDASLSSVSSIESLLEARRENPEEILLALGFGGRNRDQMSPLSRIPHRFFNEKSSAKGVHVNELAQIRGQMFFQNPSQEVLLKCQKNSEQHMCRMETGNDNEEGDSNNDGLDNGKNIGSRNKKKSNRKPNHITKVLIMGPKRYEFNDEDGELYSPHTSDNIDEYNNNKFNQFFKMANAKETNDGTIQSGNDNKKTFLSSSSPSLPVYRKLSCPCINSNDDFGDTEDGSINMHQSSSSSKKLRVPSLSSLSLSSSYNDEEFHSINNDNPDHEDNDNPNPNSNPLAPIMLINNKKKNNNKKNKHNSLIMKDFHLNQFDLISNLFNIDVNSYFMMNSFIETSLLTSINSLKMSLDFYRCFILIDDHDHDHDHLLTNNRRLKFQNLYLDVLEIETMLYDCLYKFRNSTNWIIFISKYIQQLRNAMHKINEIQLGLQKLIGKFNKNETSSSSLVPSRSSPPAAATTTSLMGNESVFFD